MLALAARLQQNAAGPTISANVSELDTHGQVRSPADRAAPPALTPFSTCEADASSWLPHGLMYQCAHKHLSAAVAAQPTGPCVPHRPRSLVTFYPLRAASRLWHVELLCRRMISNGHVSAAVSKHCWVLVCTVVSDMAGGRLSPTLLCKSSVQAITVTVTGVTDPKDTDAVALLVPYDANRSVVPPQKFQWLLKGSAGKGYLKTGASNLTCEVSSLRIEYSPTACCSLSGSLTVFHATLLRTDVDHQVVCPRGACKPSCGLTQS